MSVDSAPAHLEHMPGMGGQSVRICCGWLQPAELVINVDNSLPSLERSMQMQLGEQVGDLAFLSPASFRAAASR